MIPVIFIVLGKMVIFQSEESGRFICKGLEVILCNVRLMRKCEVDPM